MIHITESEQGYQGLPGYSGSTNGYDHTHEYTWSVKNTHEYTSKKDMCISIIPGQEVFRGILYT